MLQQDERTYTLTRQSMISQRVPVSDDELINLRRSRLTVEIRQNQRQTRTRVTPQALNLRSLNPSTVNCPETKSSPMPNPACISILSLSQGTLQLPYASARPSTISFCRTISIPRATRNVIYQIS